MQMTSEKRDLSKVYKRRDRYEIPDWQRQKVWGRPKKQQLIDSVLRGWKLPKFYFLRVSDDPEVFEVIDGQQRLTAIFEFFDNQLPLSKESAEDFGGEYYSDLPAIHSDNFDDFEIQFDQIEEAEEPELKMFFQRLQEGLPLTSSEKLNSIHSKLRDFVRQISKGPFFAVKVSLGDRRYAHFDIAAKVVGIEIESIDTGLRYDDLKAIFDSQSNFSTRSKVANRINEIFDCLDRAFPEKSPLLKNRTVVQSFATLVSRIIAGGKSAGREQALHKFFTRFMSELSAQVELGQMATDTDYIRFRRSINANVKAGARTRQEVLLRKLLMFDPKMAELFDPASIAESGVAAQIRELADSITTQISSLNSLYSAEKGVDLFKPTNKTTQALSRLRKIISSFLGYQSLISDLYYVFHEGVGSRLDSITPPSFNDVNDLRTELQHDVDHGKPSKVRAKRKKLGAAFAKYAGEPSPNTLAPERFPLLQANLLAALESDLRVLPQKVLTGSSS